MGLLVAGPPMPTTRRPSNSGTFYPTSAVELRCTVEILLADSPSTAGRVPKAIIAPHGDLASSGCVAAAAYARTIPARARIERVVLLGPVHYIDTAGIVTCTADAFETPLGDVLVDRDLLDAVEHLSCVRRADEAHVQEHSVEVHLPFLQVTLGELRIAPLLIGTTSDEAIADVLEATWGGDETLIVVSSDLSHDLEYDLGRSRDAKTSRAIERLAHDEIGQADACGSSAIRALLRVAQRRGLAVETLDVRSSGDTLAHRENVTGFGAYVLA
jgi:MEMO1 family protein